jgi:uncharacterized protein YgbK (DUF1537 family)
MVYVIADDLTGANDTGVQFSKRGYSTDVLIWNGSFSLTPVKDVDVLVIDVETRESLPAAAQDRVKRVLDELKPSKNDIVYKKIDSTLRGCIGMEIEVIMDVLGVEVCVFTPTFPFTHRITVGGYLIVQGSILESSDYYRGGHKPGEASFIPSLLHRQTKLPVSRIDLKDVAKGAQVICAKLNELAEAGNRIVVVDATDGSHLQNIVRGSSLFAGTVLYAGSAGLAYHILEKAKSNKRFEGKMPQSSNPVLIVYATRNPVMGLQIQYLENRIPCCDISIDITRILNDRSTVLKEYVDRSLNAVAELRHVIIHTEPVNDENLSKYDVLRAQYNLSERGLEVVIRDFIGTLATAIVRADTVDRLLLSGGDTALGVCTALDIHSFTIYDELFPGIPVAKAHMPKKSLTMITKAGGFGEEDVLYKVLNAIA